MYRLLRTILFLFPPESVHYFSMNFLRMLCAGKTMRNLLRSWFRPNDKTQEVFGLQFRNPAGLAAGFDKNARYLRELDSLGFGFVEIGTVTPLPQVGNPKPRLFRLKRDGALINRMGFNNDGMEKIAIRLKQWQHASFRTEAGLPMIIGGNIGKNKQTPNELAWQDYVKCFEALHSYVDYFVVNVSSPNTPGLRELQEKSSLQRIFEELQQRNNQLPKPRPLLLKIAPDLTDGQLDDVAALAMEAGLSGLVIANTTISRDGLKTPAAELQKIGAGGLSGKPLRNRALQLVRRMSDRFNGKVVVIGSGGIFSADDAREMLNAGASLFQIWTGFIYEGPTVVKRTVGG